MGALDGATAGCELEDAGVAAEFDHAIRRALAKAPDDRYPSAGDLGRAAEAAAAGVPVAEPERSVARGAAATAGDADGDPEPAVKTAAAARSAGARGRRRRRGRGGGRAHRGASG